MIIDKKNTHNGTIPQVNVNPPLVDTPVYEPEVNVMSEIQNVVMGIIKAIPENPNAPEGPKLFKTVKQNTGQLTRIKNNQHNLEYALGFPAVFIGFINVRWLVATHRIGDAKAELRICYVLNRLNNEDDEWQTEGYDVFQRINTAINDNMERLGGLTQRFQLGFWDQVENFDDGVQQYWITYEVWFRDTSTDITKDYVERYVVIPPFTNHRDQVPEANPEGHKDHRSPESDAVGGITEPEA